MGHWALGMGHGALGIGNNFFALPPSPFSLSPFPRNVVLYRNGLLDCRSELPWTTRSAITDAIKRIWRFSTPIGAASSSVNQRGFPMLRSTIVKETAESAVKSLSKKLAQS